ncbi:hypothetical protein P3S67_013882 [Capsicum chacoense]
MEIGFAVGGAFLSSSLNVLFDRLAPHGDLLKMFQKHKHDDGLLEKLEGILLGLQIVLSDAENKKASNPLVRKWLNKLQRAMDGAESLLEEVNYEALRLKVEDQLRNLAETSNQQMMLLFISDCKKLKRLPERMQELVPSLKELRLWKCPEIESFPDGGLPFNLQLLEISYCEKLVNGRKEWRLQRLLSLRELHIIHNGSDEEIVGGENWELPCSIQRLFIGNMKTLSSQLLKSLTSLEYLRTDNLPQIQSLLEQVLPSSLSELRLSLHDELHSLPTECLGHLTSLRRLEIINCPQLQSLAESALPSSLSELTIWNCPNLQSLPYLYRPKLSKRVLHNILPRLTSLRALSLSGYEFVEFPDALFIKLKLLRFLDLSRTKIKKLPDSICALYNLETLLLSYCRYLEELPLHMEKLINLRHLDISDTSRLKMPLHLSKLKSLQVLVGAKFLLGGLRMEDLGQLRNLFGSLSVLELENVVDRREAQKAKMRDKNSVEKLSLEWSGSDAENSQTERDILDELRPHTKIKEVEISGYRGTQFPNWLADHSFLNLLVQLSLSNCKDCFSLPALGQLPRLKFLSIRVMHRITEVTEEFYGCPSSKNPFNALEKLEFAEIPEWKQWHVLGNGEFPALQDLSIKDCPKLMGKLPENLCSLTELRISRCPELNLETPIQLSSLKRFEVDGSPKAGVLFDEAELFTSQLEGMKQIEKLYIRNCSSLTPLPTSTLPSTLKEIRIYCCQKLKLEAPDSSRMISDMFLENFETLDIGSCVEILSVAYGTQMTSLFISDCKNLKRLPEGMQELLPSLKELRLWDCPEIESFPDGGFPFNLQLLEIRDCEKLVNGRKEWRLQRLPHLRELEIYHNGSDKENVGGEDWELPCSIQRLKIGQLKTLSSQLLKSLTSLEYLWTRNLPQIQSLLEEVFPSFLSKLTICSCPNLQSLPESALPSSLSKLIIEGCSNLQPLSVKGMPSSLFKLSIHQCPLLKPLLEFDKGEYWSKIAHIPTIYIDGEGM